MEITKNDIRLANNTLEIDQICRHKEHIKEFEISSLKARIGNIENRIAENQQYLKQLKDELEEVNNLYAGYEEEHTRLIQVRREILGQST